MNPYQIIKALYETDRYVEVIFTQGGCYQFHVFLKKLFSPAVPYISKEKDHVATLISGILYDVTGIVTEEGFTEMTDDEMKDCEKWSFCNHKLIQLGECGFCGEPLTI